MKRASFFKSLFVLAASPKVLENVGFSRPPVEQPTIGPVPVFRDMQLIVPDWYAGLVEKWGNQDFAWWMGEVNKATDETREFVHFETPKTFPIALNQFTVIG